MLLSSWPYYFTMIRVPVFVVTYRFNLLSLRLSWKDLHGFRSMNNTISSKPYGNPISHLNTYYVQTKQGDIDLLPIWTVSSNIRLVTITCDVTINIM